jgi:alpha/beta superfamily hydrolase
LEPACRAHDPLVIMTSSVSYQHVAFPSKGPEQVTLRGLLVAPSDRKTAAFCVLVHPWGYLGGSQSHMIPYAEHLAHKHSLQCLVFNCRGVGDSGGSATLRCSAEIQDVLGACDWVITHFNAHIILIGSSAGAAVAGSVLDQVPAVKGLVAIGFTFGWCSSIVLGGHYGSILKSSKPKLFIMGDCDGFTSVSQLESRVRSMENATMHIISSGGHFSLESRHQATLVELIAAFIAKLGLKREYI